MKLINKDSLHYLKGYVRDEEGFVVSLPTRLVKDLNFLEHLYQEAKYDHKRPKELKELEPYVFQSEFDMELPIEEPKTPTINKKVREANKFMKEVDAKNQYESIKKLAEKFPALNEFVDSDEVINTESSNLDRLDLATIGNPLKLDKEKLAKIYTVIASVQV